MSTLTQDLIAAAKAQGMVIFVDSDPSVTATFGNVNTIAMLRSAVGIWIKTDSGLSTSWSPISIGGGSGGPFPLAGTLNINRNAPALGADGSVQKPFRTFTAALAVIPPNTPMTLLVAPGSYNEEPGNAVAWKNLVTAQGLNAGQTGLEFTLNYTAPPGEYSAWSMNDVSIQTPNGIVLDMAAGVGGFLSCEGGAYSITHMSYQPNFTNFISGAFADSTLQGTTFLRAGVLFGTVTIPSQPGNLFIFASSVAGGGHFELFGQCKLRTLASTAFTSYVNGTMVGPDTPTWETDVASSTPPSTGAVNQVIL